MIKVPKSVLPTTVADELKQHGVNYLAAKAAADSNRVAALAAKTAGDDKQTAALEAKAASEDKKAADIKKKYSIVKKYLVADFNKKYAYCESKVRHISAGQTDHFLPVSEDPTLLFEWSNLVLACENCNRKKNAYHDTQLPLINPLVDDPSAHLTFLGPMIDDLDERGEITISQLDLDGDDLTCERAERLRKLGHTIKRLSPTISAATKQMLLNQLQAEGEPSKSYSMMVKLFVKIKLGRLLAS